MPDSKSSTSRTSTKSEGFTADEKSAMRERAKELKAEARKEDGAKALRDAIAAMGESDRALAERFDAIVMESAPDLSPKTWYGMPAYAKDDKIICFFQSADKFKARYATFGFNEDARLDDGNMWPTSFALMKLTAAEEKTIAALIKKAVAR